MKIYAKDGTGHVWDANDAQELREVHRIVGTLIGCLPRKPRQNVQLSLPLELLPEEVNLLLKIGVAELVDDSQIPQTPSDQIVTNYKHFRENSFLEQVELCKAERRRVILKNRDRIIEGRRKKAAKMRKLKRGVDDDNDDEADNDFNVDDIQIKPITESQSLIQIPTANWLPSDGEVSRVEWSYPQTDRQRVRCRVFEDLWRRGYFLTSGNKFGGDFLVYPGDPALYHSMYVAVCRLYTGPMNASEIVSMGRMGTNVKKTLLLCSVDDDEGTSGNLVYTSIRWTGIV
ncbi:tRNA-splicing endonuclease subunit Sen34-like [Tubulanus polymorphus]|uniref:tRNA-splicing endonuclease subunit Sen34-like n=1 Tax=Tubulanus polymorphus TaxID=672921 RepID=UPI003DA59588